MADQVKDVNCRYWYEDYDLTAILQARVQEELPELVASKQIHVLAAIDSNSQQLEVELRRLRLGAIFGTILIPYNIGGVHWTGIVLEFSAPGLLKHAYYIDPLRSQMSQNLQSRFKSIYPAHELQNVEALKQEDHDSCGPYTIENLLLVACKAQVSQISAQEIRKKHLDCLRRWRQDFYPGFVRRQANAQCSVEQANKRRAFREYFNLALELAWQLDQLSAPEIKEQLWAALKLKAEYVNNVSKHLQAIRMALKHACVLLKEKAQEVDQFILQKIIFLLFGYKWKIGFECVLDQAQLCIDYEDLLFVSKRESMANRQLQVAITRQILEERRVAYKQIEQVVDHKKMISLHMPLSRVLSALEAYKIEYAQLEKGDLVDIGVRLIGFHITAAIDFKTTLLRMQSKTFTDLQEINIELIKTQEALKELRAVKDILKFFNDELKKLDEAYVKKLQELTQKMLTVGKHQQKRGSEFIDPNLDLDGLYERSRRTVKANLDKLNVFFKEINVLYVSMRGEILKTLDILKRQKVQLEKQKWMLEFKEDLVVLEIKFTYSSITEVLQDFITLILQAIDKRSDHKVEELFLEFRKIVGQQGTPFNNLMTASLEALITEYYSHEPEFGLQALHKLAENLPAMQAKMQHFKSIENPITRADIENTIMYVLEQMGQILVLTTIKICSGRKTLETETVALGKEYQLRYVDGFIDRRGNFVLQELGAGNYVFKTPYSIITGEREFDVLGTIKFVCRAMHNYAGKIRAQKIEISPHNVNCTVYNERGVMYGEEGVSIIGSQIDNIRGIIMAGSKTQRAVCKIRVQDVINFYGEILGSLEVDVYAQHMNNVHGRVNAFGRVGRVKVIGDRIRVTEHSMVVGNTTEIAAEYLWVDESSKVGLSERKTILKVNRLHNESVLCGAKVELQSLEHSRASNNSRGAKLARIADSSVFDLHYVGGQDVSITLPRIYDHELVTGKSLRIDYPQGDLVIQDELSCKNSGRRYKFQDFGGFSARSITTRGEVAILGKKAIFTAYGVNKRTGFALELDSDVGIKDGTIDFIGKSLRQTTGIVGGYSHASAINFRVQNLELKRLGPYGVFTTQELFAWKFGVDVFQGKHKLYLFLNISNDWIIKDPINLRGLRIVGKASLCAKGRPVIKLLKDGIGIEEFKFRVVGCVLEVGDFTTLDPISFSAPAGKLVLDANKVQINYAWISGRYFIEITSQEPLIIGDPQQSKKTPKLHGGEYVRLESNKYIECYHTDFQFNKHLYVKSPVKWTTHGCHIYVGGKAALNVPLSEHLIMHGSVTYPQVIATFVAQHDMSGETTHYFATSRPPCFIAKELVIVPKTGGIRFLGGSLYVGKFKPSAEQIVKFEEFVERFDNISRGWMGHRKRKRAQYWCHATTFNTKVHPSACLPLEPDSKQPEKAELMVVTREQHIVDKKMQIRALGSRVGYSLEPWQMFIGFGAGRVPKILLTTPHSGSSSYIRDLLQFTQTEHAFPRVVLTAEGFERAVDSIRTLYSAQEEAIMILKELIMRIGQLPPGIEQFDPQLLYYWLLKNSLEFVDRLGKTDEFSVAREQEEYLKIVTKPMLLYKKIKILHTTGEEEVILEPCLFMPFNYQDLFIANFGDSLIRALSKTVRELEIREARCLAEMIAWQRANRKHRKIAQQLLIIAVVPFAAGLLVPIVGVIGSGVIIGGINASINKQDVFEGMVQGVLFAGVDFGAQQISACLPLGPYGQEIARVTINASAATAIHGGKLLDNVGIAIGAHTIARTVVPFSKVEVKTPQGIVTITEPTFMQQVARGVVEAGATATLHGKDLGSALIAAGSSGLQIASQMVGRHVGAQISSTIQRRELVETKQVEQQEQPMQQQVKKAELQAKERLGQTAQNPNSETQELRRVAEVKPKSKPKTIIKSQERIPKYAGKMVTVLTKSGRALIMTEEEFKRYQQSLSISEKKQHTLTSSDMQTTSGRERFQLPSALSFSSNPVMMHIGATGYAIEQTRDFLVDVLLQPRENAKEALIGYGRGLTKLGQGIKQFSLEIGEKSGLIGSGKVAAYTRRINAETVVYNSSAVGQSAAGRFGEFCADGLMLAAVPVVGSGTRFIASMAATGAVLQGLQSTTDGSLSTRAGNALEGGVWGAGAGIIGLGVQRVMVAKRAGDLTLSSRQNRCIPGHEARASAQAVQAPEISLAAMSGRAEAAALSSTQCLTHVFEQQTARSTIRTTTEISRVSHSIKPTVLPSAELAQSIAVVEREAVTSAEIVAQRTTTLDRAAQPIAKYSAVTPVLDAEEVLAAYKYDQIRSMDATVNVQTIARNTNMPEQIIANVREHIFMREHVIQKAHQTTTTGIIDLVRQKFEPIFSTVEIWEEASKKVLAGERLEEFQRLIVHEHVESELMKHGVPFRSDNPLVLKKIGGEWCFGDDLQFPGAHDLAPMANFKKPLWDHWKEKRHPIFSNEQHPLYKTLRDLLIEMNIELPKSSHIPTPKPR